MINKSKGISLCSYERSKINFLSFTDQQMETYLDSNEWEGRSGSLTIEDSGDWVSSIEGDYWNIVGLPINLLKKMMKEAGI